MAGGEHQRRGPLIRGRVGRDQTGQRGHPVQQWAGGSRRGLVAPSKTRADDRCSGAEKRPPATADVLHEPGLSPPVSRSPASHPVNDRLEAPAGTRPHGEFGDQQRNVLARDRPPAALEKGRMESRDRQREVGDKIRRHSRGHRRPIHRADHRRLRIGLVDRGQRHPFVPHRHDEIGFGLTAEVRRRLDRARILRGPHHHRDPRRLNHRRVPEVDLEIEDRIGTVRADSGKPAHGTDGALHRSPSRPLNKRHRPLQRATPAGNEDVTTRTGEDPLAARHQRDQLIVQIEVARRQIRDRLSQHAELDLELGLSGSRRGQTLFEASEPALDLGESGLEVGPGDTGAGGAVGGVVHCLRSTGFQGTRFAPGAQRYRALRYTRPVLRPDPRPIGGVIVATVLIALGCAPAEPPSGDVVARFIDPDPETVLATSDLVDTTLEADLGPTTPAAAEAWRGHDVRIFGVRDGALEFEQDGDDPWLAIDTAIDADSIVAVEVELQNPGPAEVQLFWAGRWQRFSMKRMARPARTRSVGAGTFHSRFDVGDNPEWKGELRSLRVDVPPGAEGRVRLGAVRIFRGEIDDEKMTAAAARPWKIDLGRSTRNALLAPPGTNWDLRLVVPDDANLVLSYGLHPSGHGSVRFRAFSIEDDAEPSVLLDDTVSADGAAAGAWIDRVVDLSGLAGRELTLRLSTEAAADYDPGRGQAVWGNPEIIAPSAPDDRPNVVLVVLDTLRADRLSCYGHPLETSPNIDRWAAGSAVRFANVVAPAPWTLPSHASLFTGLDALRHGFNFWGTAPPTLEMGAEFLRRNGYTTAAFTGGGILRPAFGFAQGFDTFDYWGEPTSDDEVEWVFESARRWLDGNRQRRFFLFVHTYEIHAPHRRRQPYFDELAGAAGVEPAPFDLALLTHPWHDLVAPGDYFVVDRPGSKGWSPTLSDIELQTVGLMYDSEVATVDDEVGRLLDHIRSLGLSGRTMVIVTSDHGEALGEDGHAGHSYLEDYNLMVPLILELPAQTHAGTVVDTQVRLVDLLPTILDVVGIESPENIDGRSLLSVVADPSTGFPHRAWAYAASSNRGLALRVDNRLKYVFPDPAWAEVADREGLFDLESDPGEDENLAPADPRLDDLRAVTRETILAEHQGVRLEISNAGDGVLRGRLQGAWAAHDRVKTSDHRDNPVHWTSDHPASFELEPGGRTTLLFTQLDAAEVGLEIWAEGTDSAEVTFDTTFDLAALHTPAALHLTDRGWQLDEDFTGAVKTGFLITRVGDLQPIVSDGLPSNAEVIEQLKALGYIQ